MASFSVGSSSRWPSFLRAFFPLLYATPFDLPIRNTSSLAYTPVVPSASFSWSVQLFLFGAIPRQICSSHSPDRKTCMTCLCGSQVHLETSASTVLLVYAAPTPISASTPSCLETLVYNFTGNLLNTLPQSSGSTWSALGFPSSALRHGDATAQSTSTSGPSTFVLGSSRVLSTSQFSFSGLLLSWTSGLACFRNSVDKQLLDQVLSMVAFLYTQHLIAICNILSPSIIPSSAL